MFTEYMETLLIEAGRRKQITRVAITRKTKIKRSQSQLSTGMAKQKNDPLYALMKKYCDRCKDYRERIHKKYASRNRTAARK